MDSVSVYYPEYNLDWVLRTDASKFGIGYVLYQIYLPPDGGEPQHQVIKIGSKEFSAHAQKWPTIEQEPTMLFETACTTYFANLLC